MDAEVPFRPDLRSITVRTQAGAGRLQLAATEGVSVGRKDLPAPWDCRIAVKLLGQEQLRLQPAGPRRQEPHLLLVVVQRACSLQAGLRTLWSGLQLLADRRVVSSCPGFASPSRQVSDTQQLAELVEALQHAAQDGVSQGERGVRGAGRPAGPVGSQPPGRAPSGTSPVVCQTGDSGQCLPASEILGLRAPSQASAVLSGGCTKSLDTPRRCSETGPVTSVHDRANR